MSQSPEEYIKELSNIFLDDLKERDPSRALLFNHSVESLKALDSFIEDLWEGEPPSKNGYMNVLKLFGAYVADVIMRDIPKGHWKKSSFFEYEYSLNYKKNDEFTFLPWVWVDKRLKDNELIFQKYNEIKKTFLKL